MSLILEVVKAALSAVIGFWILLLIGVIFGKFPREAPVLTKEARAALSHTSYLMCLPMFIFYKMGSGLTLTVLGSSWIVIIWGAFHCLIAFLTSGLIGCIFNLDIKHRKPYALCASISNFTAMPLILMVPLCKSNLLGDAATCTSSAAINIFLYGVLLYFFLFGLFWNYLEAPTARLERHDSSSLPTHNWLTRAFTDVVHMLWKSCTKPPVLAIILGVFVGLITPLRLLFFGADPVLAPLTDTINLVGSAAVPLMGFVLAGLFIDPVYNSIVALMHMCCKPCAKPAASHGTDSHEEVHLPDVHVPAASAPVASEVKPSVSAVTTPSEVLDGEIAVSVSGGVFESTAGAVAVADQAATSAASKAKHAKTALGYTIALVFVRLILTPAIAFGFFILFDKLNITWLLPPTKVGKFIVLIQAGMPSAESCAMVLEELGLKESAHMLTGGFVGQYSLSLVSMTVLIMLAINYVADSPV